MTNVYDQKTLEPILVCSKQILQNSAFFCWDKPTTIPYPVATYVFLEHRSGDKRI